MTDLTLLLLLLSPGWVEVMEKDSSLSDSREQRKRRPDLFTADVPPFNSTLPP